MKPAIILLAFTSIALGQGYYPPLGAPGPTFRSMDEINPRIPLNQFTAPGNSTCVFKITKAGSYMLTGNIKPPAGKNGILIALPAPGTVDVDLMGFAIDGTEAGLGAAATLTDNDATWTDNQFLSLRHGIISNFAGGSCLAPAATGGTIALRDISIHGGGAGISTAAAAVELKDVIISSVTGIPIQVGNESSLERVTIKTSHAGIPKLIEGGAGCRFTDILISSVMGGSTHASAITLGPNSRINGMRLSLTDAIFTGPVMANTSGFTEVSGLSVDLNSVTAPCACNSYSFGISQAGLIGTTYGGDGQTTVVAANNCTFSNAVAILPAGLTTSLNNGAAFKLTGTTTTPTVVRVEADNAFFTYEKIAFVGTATVSVAVIDIAASGTTTRANIVGGGVGVRISSGTGNTVEGCNFTGLPVPAVAIQISGGVTNSLVRNNTAARLAAGGVLVQNNGGSTNFIAPVISTPAQLTANTNPFANIVH